MLKLGGRGARAKHVSRNTIALQHHFSRLLRHIYIYSYQVDQLSITGCLKIYFNTLKMFVKLIFLRILAQFTNNKIKLSLKHLLIQSLKVLTF